MPYTPTWNNPYLPQGATALPYPTPYQQVQPTNQYQQGIIKVNGRDSALQYVMPPNSQSPALFDSGGRQFYIVSTDGTGTKTVETFDFQPHVEEPPKAQEMPVSRSEFDALAAKVNAMIGAADGVYGPVQTANAASAANPTAEGIGTGK